MEFVDQTLREFLTSAASARPVPGGGAVAALTGALACTMAEMAANYTFGKKKFAAVQAQIQDLRDQLARLRSRLVKLMDDDAEAFTRLQGAQHMPKGDTQQIAARQIQIDSAASEAAAVPATVADICVEVLAKAKAVAEICNPKLLSDVGVCAHLARGALVAANLNVAVNLRGSMDVDRQEAETAKMTDRVKAADRQVADIEAIMATRGAVGSPAETGMFDATNL